MMFICCTAAKQAVTCGCNTDARNVCHRVWALEVHAYVSGDPQLPKFCNIMHSDHRLPYRLRRREPWQITSTVLICTIDEGLSMGPIVQAFFMP